MNWEEIEYPYGGQGVARALWFIHFLEVSGVFPAKVLWDPKADKWKKQPFTKRWQTAGQGSADTIDTALNLWKRYPGADCGVLLGSHVLIDLDHSEDADGVENFKKLVSGLGLDLERDGAFPLIQNGTHGFQNLAQVLAGCYVWSTPGRLGGIHILALSSDRSFYKTVPTPGVEVLGAGHYFLSPGSKRPDKPGGTYELLQIPDRLTELPRPLWDALTRNKAQTSQPLSDEGESYLNGLMTKWFADWSVRCWMGLPENFGDYVRKERPNDGWLLIMRQCPFIEDHRGSASIGVWNGQLHFLCLGARCSKRSWNDFQSLVEKEVIKYAN